MKNLLQYLPLGAKLYAPSGIFQWYTTGELKMTINYIVQIADRKPNGYYEDFRPYRGITEKEAVKKLEETRIQFPGEIFRLYIENWGTGEFKTIV